MKQELSILIPVYNDVGTPLVTQLHKQATGINGLQYEIIVADDGSTDSAVIKANSIINDLPHCHYLLREFNSGRAAIRNFLAQQAHYEWLLFLDGDMSIKSESFLHNYLEAADCQVVYGGYCVGEGEPGNLRYRYEKASERLHTAAQRQQHPYRDFHTSNFMILRELMMSIPFDERFLHYGYEDVLFGKTLSQHHIRIKHIDNPVGFDTFEPNEQFLAKTEEGMRTLHDFRNELRGYNNLLTLVGGIHIAFVRSAIRLWHRLFAPLERRILTGRHPSLTLFRLYKLGYYLTLTKND